MSAPNINGLLMAHPYGAVLLIVLFLVVMAFLNVLGILQTMGLMMHGTLQ